MSVYLQETLMKGTVEVHYGKFRRFDVLTKSRILNRWSSLLL